MNHGPLAIRHTLPPDLPLAGGIGQVERYLAASWKVDGVLTAWLRETVRFVVVTLCEQVVVRCAVEDLHRVGEISQTAEVAECQVSGAEAERPVRRAGAVKAGTRESPKNVPPHPFGRPVRTAGPLVTFTTVNLHII